MKVVEDNKLTKGKDQTTREIFNEFYGKPIDELTTKELGKDSELDWGEDVGHETLT